MDGLSKEQVDKFTEDGYLLIENFCTPEECDRLRSRCHQIIDEADLQNHPKVVFSTKENKQIADDYFLTSGDKIRFFFEDGAFGEDGKLVCDRKLAINKVAHALHALDPLYKEFTFSEKVKGICKSLALKKPAVVQSMCILKPPKLGSVVRPHQDSSFLHTEPKKLVGFWLALEDADVENGCLWFAPGSHNKELALRLLRETSKDGHFDMKIEGTPPDLSDDQYKLAAVKKGTMVVLHGEVVHKSGKNDSDRSRNIYTFHVYDAGVSKWDERNWLQPTEELPFPHLY